ncbi:MULTISPECIES: 3-keto-5-aminohexanoate cleavage protein [unclassified Bradyrhizobium]|uniref:3-keto-5-aminohexanoate cleavage protein n=1 Tax=unclassified Bradyrhizobium TaxID=2631580 RepID=UPI002306BBC9|nr:MULTISPECIES: 3-keto-5-aminohexanoate cleavage protein [unclassified Bradyrhizobium]
MSLDKNGINWGHVDRWVSKTGIKTSWQPYGIPDIMDPNRSRYSNAAPMPRWEFPEKVFVSAAINGAFFTKRENPHQPVTVDEIIASAEECIKAGAPVIHVHARDEAGYNVLDKRLFEQVILPLRAKYPHVSFDACLVAVNDSESAEMAKVMEAGLIDAVPINTTSVLLGDNMFVKSPHAMIEKARMTLAAGMKPQIAVYTDGDVDNARRFLIDSGLLEPPFVWAILSALPGCSPMYDPDSMIDGLQRTVRLIRAIDPNSVIMVCAAGRASTHLASLALLMGLHVRVGMEDTVWKWPHRDDMITSNAEHYKLVVSIARGLGREIMSADEYRSLIGVPAPRRLKAAAAG